MNKSDKPRHTATITTERSIESLIEELEQLQIQQAVVLDAIIERTGAANVVAPTIANAPSAYQTAPSPSAAQPASRSTASTAHPDTYRIRDSVRITNPVRVNGRVSNIDDDYIGVVEKLTHQGEAQR